MVWYCAVSTTGSVTGLYKFQMSTNVNMQLTALIIIITPRLHSEPTDEYECEKNYVGLIK